MEMITISRIRLMSDRSGKYRLRRRVRLQGQMTREITTCSVISRFAANLIVVPSVEEGRMAYGSYNGSQAVLDLKPKIKVRRCEAE